MTPTNTRPVSVLDAPGRSIAKFLICLAQSEGVLDHALELARVHARSTPQVEKALTYASKSAVAAGATSGYAAALTQYGIAGETFAVMLSDSILGPLFARFARLPFRVKAPKDLGAVGGAWKGEGLPRAAMRSTTDTLTMDIYEAIALVLASRELMRFGAAAEATLVTMVTRGVSNYVVGQMFDPTIAGTAAHPESLTYRAAVVTTAGTSAANVITDLTALASAIQSPGRDLIWLMPPLTYLALCAKLASAGLAVTPNTLLGLPVLLSAALPEQITLLDCSVIAYASDDVVELDVSTRADVQMEDPPTQDAIAGTGSTMVSLYQTSMVAIGANLRLNYQHIFDGAGSPTRAAGCAYCAVTY